ncbi:hypothetical protein CC2G_012067 [Coprinopsis cinerea AmutBmut pab1-1]|nr:hypothetical protein CC2G_012067 [Coprinopsis cinerea AmutBmut pab1-1]
MAWVGFSTTSRKRTGVETLTSSFWVMMKDASNGVAQVKSYLTVKPSGNFWGPGFCWTAYISLRLIPSRGSLDGNFRNKVPRQRGLSIWLESKWLILNP